MSQTIRSVDRALEILLCFSREKPELSMTQISEDVGIHKSTVHRLLATLEKKRFVERDPISGSYRLGITILEMAYLTLDHNNLRQITERYLRTLAEQFGETANLAILDGAEMVYLNVVESNQRVKLAATIGQRLPAFCTASGKAVLAYSPQEVVQEVLAQGMEKYTPNTISSQESYLQNLLLTHKRGFSLSLQEFEEGINAIAAPILDHNNQPIAALALAGPSFRLTEDRMLQIGPELMSTAREISLKAELATNV